MVFYFLFSFYTPEVPIKYKYGVSELKSNISNDKNIGMYKWVLLTFFFWALKLSISGSLKCGSAAGSSGIMFLLS